MSNLAYLRVLTYVNKKNKSYPATNLLLLVRDFYRFDFLINFSVFWYFYVV